jgi:hypothetical protein
MVTSAIAIPALPAIRDNKANARCNFFCSDSTSMEMTPRKPEINCGRNFPVSKCIQQSTSMKNKPRKPILI